MLAMFKYDHYIILNAILCRIVKQVVEVPQCRVSTLRLAGNSLQVSGTEKNSCTCSLHVHVHYMYEYMYVHVLVL